MISTPHAILKIISRKFNPRYSYSFKLTSSSWNSKNITMRHMSDWKNHKVIESSDYDHDDFYEDVDFAEDGNTIDDNNEHEQLNVPVKRERHTKYKFIDKVQLSVQGGKGGNGCISYEVLNPSKKRPTGGNGGHGGSVFVIADKSLMGLKFEKYQFRGGFGGHGGGDGMTGRNGENSFIKVPVGTLVSEILSEEVKQALMETQGYETTDYPIYELNKDGDILQVAEGGKPGTGNKTMKGSKLQQGKSSPRTKIPGETGQERTILLELKLIADVGLVGFPNAGKSSLLRALSNAKPKIAAYPFTTLHPTVGVVEYTDLERLTVADIPGIIEGAHENRGLGLDFLRHIERTKILLYVVDIAGGDGRTPLKDFKQLVKELHYYDPDMLAKPALIFGNKTDLKINKKYLETFSKAAEKLGLKILLGSASTGEGIAELAETLRVMTFSAEGNQAQGINRDGIDEEDSDDI